MSIGGNPLTNAEGESDSPSFLWSYLTYKILG
ncbi:MAG: hypothetical protein K0R67_1314, partial [Paenibacillus sp.]|nr:hypothetical protein [Paenibacillus sp.]